MRPKYKAHAIHTQHNGAVHETMIRYAIVDYEWNRLLASMYKFMPQRQAKALDAMYDAGISLHMALHRAKGILPEKQIEAYKALKGSFKSLDALHDYYLATNELKVINTDYRKNLKNEGTKKHAS